MSEVKDSEVKDQEWVKKNFPDAGQPPSNKIVVDPNAAKAPNTAHPE